MCKQVKIGFTNCPHVYADGDIEPCHVAIETAKTIRPMHEEGNTFCENIEWEWKDDRELGCCFWCWQMMKESPKRKRKREKLLGLTDKETDQVKDRVISGSMDEVLDGATNEATDEVTDTLMT